MAYSLYGAQILADGAQVYYRLNEASGTTAHDLTRNHYDATLSGINAYSQIGALLSDDDTSIQFNNPFTITVPNPPNLATWSVASLEYWLNTGSSWIYYVLTVNGATTLLYTNGVAQQLTSITVSQMLTWFTNHVASGTVDEFALYSYILSPQQIIDHYYIGTVQLVSSGGGGGMTFLTYYNVLQYGATGDGSTDDTAAIASAITAASAGGIVFFPPGTYLSTTQTLVSNVILMGAGIGASTLKLKNATNADLLSALTGSINLSASGGSGSTTAINKFGIFDMTLDGNKANQSSGTSYPLRFYGYGFTLQNIAVINGFTGGILYDYSGTMPVNYTLEPAINNVRVHDNNGFGLEHGGPTDTRWNAMLVYNSGSSNIHSCPNSSGLLAVNCHTWSPGITDVNNASWLVEATIRCVNCEAEGSNNAQLVILRNGVCWHGGSVFAGGATGAGIQIGQAAGGTPITGSLNQSAGVTTAVTTTYYDIATEILLITSANGAINVVSDGGGMLQAVIEVGTGTNTAVNGTPSNKSTFIINTIGFTADGTSARAGQLRVAANNNKAFTVTDTSLEYLNMNLFSSKRLELVNAASLRMYSDNYTTIGLELFSGTVAYGQSATAPDPTTGGTITTSGVGVARVSPAGAETGIILQAGTQHGQRVTVINEAVAANTLTFNATPATSKVADSATEPNIPGLTARAFIWDSVTALWYRMT